MESRDLEVLAWRLLEESNDAVLLVDAASHSIQEANPITQKLTGMPWRELRGRPLTEIVCGLEGPLMCFLSAVQKTGFFHSREGYALVRRDQCPLPINLSVSRLHLPSGDVALVVARDISERTNHERMLRQQSDELAQQVEERTAHLRLANDRLKQEVEQRIEVEAKLRQATEQLQETIEQLDRAQEQALQRERIRAVGEIASGVAHDVNNSISTVISFSELLLKQDLNEEQLNWTRGIYMAGSDVAATVRRLREFYQQPANAREDVIDLVKLAKDAVKFTSPKWSRETQGARISVDVRVEDAATAVGDESALRTVLTNLILNAVDAVGDEGEILVLVMEQSNTAVIEVRDDGVGMTDDERERCFAPFYTTKADGTGLGLSICETLVNSCGGRLNIDSSPGDGTSVRITLPTASDVKSQPLSSRALATTADDFQWAGQRVLYIDDDEAARDSLAVLMTTLGLRVDIASDGASGLEMFQERPHDVVFTDLSMHGLNGHDVTAAVKRICPSTPVVVISGWQLDTDPPVPPDAVLDKPVFLSDLQATLSRVISLSNRGMGSVG